jgi:hypothetical protein
VWQHQPPAAASGPRTGLLVGLVLVLLAMCGGLAFTGWQVLGGDDPATSKAAGRPSERPTAAASGAAPAPVTPVPTSAAPSSAGSSSAGPSDIPPGSAPQPIGISHVVTWPDHLQAVVYRVQRNDLPVDVQADHPLDVAVLVEVQIMNNTPADVTIKQARVRLWYGANRQPADGYEDGRGFDATIRWGGKVAGEYAFAVPPEGLTKLEIELIPRPGDAPARWVGSVG